MRNLRITWRGLMRSPVFALVAIASLALGVGANTAIFSLLDQIILRTLPVQNPDELVYLYHPGPAQGSVSTDEDGGPSFSYPMFRELQKAQQAFAGIAAASRGSGSISYNRQSAIGVFRFVSGNYFSVMGVRPAIGRLFTEEEDRTLGGHPVTVLNHAYWTSRFGNDPGVLNQPLIVNGYPMTIVGVTQKGFGCERTAEVPDIFVPITMKKELTPDWDGMRDRRWYWATLLARLKPGISREQAETAINIPYRAQLELDVPLLNKPSRQFLERFRAKKIVLKPGSHGRGDIGTEGVRPLSILMTMTLLVLAIAAANVANLQLARGAARTREIAVRLAMGASRTQLIRQLLTESCLLAVIGGALGLILARWTLRAIIAALPNASGMQTFLSTELSGRMLLFSLALALLTGILFGLFPALQASKPQLATALKDQSGQTTATGSTNFFRRALVTGQIAVSLLLLICAGLFARTLVNLSKVDLGIQPDHLVTFSISPKNNGYDDARTRAFYDELTDRLSAIPGVRIVSAARVPVIAGSTSRTSLDVEGYVPPNDDAAQSNINSVAAGYFRTMGIPLIAGREFTPADNLAAPKVAIVNEAFVRHFLPSVNPIGRRMGNKLELTIVGVVKDARYAGIKEAPPITFYTAHTQSARQGGLNYYVRTHIDPDQLMPQIRRAVAALDPNLPLREMKTMQVQIEENMFVERLVSALTGIFAALAALLAAVGLYGVLAYNIARRTREIGIRMALGAAASHLRGMIAREVALMLAIGATVGLASALGASRLFRSLLYGMETWDPFVYSAGLTLVCLIALLSA